MDFNPWYSDRIRIRPYFENRIGSDFITIRIGIQAKHSDPYPSKTLGSELFEPWLNYRIEQSAGVAEANLETGIPLEDRPTVAEPAVPASPVILAFLYTSLENSLSIHKWCDYKYPL